MLDKPIDQITEKNLQALVENCVPESKTLEYKESLPGNSDGDKKEFLADVSSFANAGGGDLVFGIVEDKETGHPKDLKGLDVNDMSHQVERLENIVRTGIEPRIPGISMRQIPLNNDQVAFVVRIPKSWISPHRVCFGGHDKFYSRNSKGKYPLDVAELRLAFNMSETITERIRRFRLDRISKILADDTPVPIHGNHKIVLHVVPVISFNPGQSFDLGETYHSDRMKPMFCTGWKHRYNLDGVLNYASGESYSYVQLFRNGIVEAVDGALLEPREGKLFIPSVRYEQELIQALTEYLSVIRSLTIVPPIFTFLTLLGVKAYTMSVSRERFSAHDLHPVDRDVLTLPEAVVEDYGAKAEAILKPSFDSLWNACGFERSFNYNDQGEWNPPR